MKFRLSKDELYVLNKYLKSPTIKNTLANDKIELPHSELTEVTESLVTKSLLQREVSGYILADNVKPFAKALDFSNFRVMTTVEVNGEDAVESTGICAVKKNTIGVYEADGDLFTLAFHDISAIDAVLSDFLKLDIDELSADSALPPFLITLPTKHMEKFVEMYESDSEGALNKYQKIIGLPPEHLRILVSTVFKSDCRSEFVVQTKKGYVLCTTHKKNGTTIVGCRREALLGEKITISHRCIGDFVKCVCL